jgi:hypothetical protein
MKKIAIVCASVLFFVACQKNSVTTKANHLEDVVLENKNKDAEVTAKKKPKPIPTDPIQPPIIPPTTTDKTIIYLDFDGQIVSGTVWSSGTITCNSSGLTATQQETIRSRVAADYAEVSPNIVVSTSESEFYSYPMNKRLRVILCSNNWYNSNAGGVAYINSYTWGDDTPCFIFTGSYGYNVDNISYAASHEPGHTFGCRHQSLWDAACIKTSEYRSGCIMGWGSEWAIGTSSLGCNTIQNDIEVIKTNL